MQVLNGPLCHLYIYVPFIVSCEVLVFKPALICHVDAGIVGLQGFVLCKSHCNSLKFLWPALASHTGGFIDRCSSTMCVMRCRPCYAHDVFAMAFAAQRRRTATHSSSAFQAKGLEECLELSFSLRDSQLKALVLEIATRLMTSKKRSAQRPFEFVFVLSDCYCFKQSREKSVL